MIDTGGSFGLSLLNGIHPEIKPHRQSPKVRVGSGLGGEILGFNGKAVIRLNDRWYTESKTIYIDEKDFSKKGKDQHKQGSIGNELLREFVVIFDYVNARMLLQPYKQELLTKHLNDQ